ncbi:DNA repair protein XRCC3 [Latimeria chalumnae]|uniref:DNA repair protein n=1 Tax=Latimeria chalumnae TaxID=7897 RepID=H3AJP1_LATCH|nr:PREDICTED: DNA repair protein XRCC3 [Latimeria chalumnae]|eukprot:XP_006003397.1 PREDICTED: DNA repair protein XRCC3 [Latimeria chalumnae]
MDWDQFDLHPRVVAAVKRAKLKSIKEILSLSGPDLQRLTKLSSINVRHLQKTVATTALQKSPMVTVLQLYQGDCPFPVQNQRLSLGCPVLDHLLRGGIPIMGITDLAGESSAGKTQICMQLCLSVQYPCQYGGLEAGAVYVCTEDAFPSKRLQQLIIKQHNLRSDVPVETIKKIKFGDKIFIEHVADIDSLNDCITKRIPILLSRGLIRLVIIDSLAALFRCEFAASSSIAKAKCLQNFGAALHGLSNKFLTPVVCINQVTAAVGDSNIAPNNFGLLDTKVLPALGLTWSNHILMRLMVTRTKHFIQEKFPGETVQTFNCNSVLRTMEVIFAPHLPQSFCYYIICLEGVKGFKDLEHG